MSNRIRLLACAVTCAGASAPGTALGQTTETVPDQASCAAQDVRFVTRIEQLGVEGFDTSAINGATTTMLQARAACRDGRFADGMRLYWAIELPALQ